VKAWNLIGGGDVIVWKLPNLLTLTPGMPQPWRSLQSSGCETRKSGEWRHGETCGRLGKYLSWGRWES